MLDSLLHLIQCLHYSSSTSVNLYVILTIHLPHQFMKCGYLNIISIRTQESNHSCSESFSIFWFYLNMCSTHYTYGYFVQQLCRFHHLVPQSLLIRHMTLFIRMSPSDTLCFMISHLFLLVHSVILLHHHQFCYPTWLSQLWQHSLGSYMVHQVSSTASFFSFTSVFFPSKHSLIQDTGASISISQTKTISFHYQTLNIHNSAWYLKRPMC